MQSPSYLVMSGGIEGKKMGVKDMGGGNYYGSTLLLLNYKIRVVWIMMIILPMSYILLIGPGVCLKSRVLDLSPVFMKHWQLAKMINSHWVGSGIPRLAVARLEDPFLHLSLVLHLASL